MLILVKYSNVISLASTLFRFLFESVTFRAVPSKFILRASLRLTLSVVISVSMCQ